MSKTELPDEETMKRLRGNLMASASFNLLIKDNLMVPINLEYFSTHDMKTVTVPAMTTHGNGITIATAQCLINCTAGEYASVFLQAIDELRDRYPITEHLMLGRHYNLGNFGMIRVVPRPSIPRAKEPDRNNFASIEANGIRVYLDKPKGPTQLVIETIDGKGLISIPFSTTAATFIHREMVEFKQKDSETKLNQLTKTIDITFHSSIKNREISDAFYGLKNAGFVINEIDKFIVKFVHPAYPRFRVDWNLYEGGYNIVAPGIEEMAFDVECILSADGEWCETHLCGSTDDAQCGKIGCPHCVGLQQLINSR